MTTRDGHSSDIPSRADYVGTLIGESTSREFRLALAEDTVREQDIIAVDAELGRRDADVGALPLRIWAKVQRIERVNPLFPLEAGHELAATRTDPLDTVLSLSREMVTAVCQVLGAEPLGETAGSRLEHVRYPPRPASTAYLPAETDLRRVILGELDEQSQRAIEIGTLANRPEITVSVDGHAIVSRHLAILAMTGAGKSWTARRIIEQLAAKHYPIVIFDPHGDYTGLAEVPQKAENSQVNRYFASIPVLEEDAETVSNIVNNLGYAMSDTMRARFPEVFEAAQAFYVSDTAERNERSAWLAGLLNREQIARYGMEPDLWLIAMMAEAGEILLRNDDGDGKRRLHDWGWPKLAGYSRTDIRTLEGIKKRAFQAAKVLQRMEQINRQIAKHAAPLPHDRRELVTYDGISIVSMAGYTSDFQATIFSMVAEQIFDLRVRNELPYPVFLVLEEAHTFAPAQAATEAERRAMTVARQIAQEGRKFGVGLLLISQRPSRLDETTLSQCNSFIIMRMVNPADQTFVRRVVETLGEEEARMLPDLDVGEALLSGQLITFPLLIRVTPPASQGEREERDAFAELEDAHAQAKKGGR